MVARAAALALFAAAVLLPGCGGDESNSRSAPSAAQFPKPEGRTLEALLNEEGGGPKQEGPFVAPAAAVHRADGQARYAFVLFDAARDFVKGVESIALYVEDPGGGPARGPYPARVESLRTQQRYRSKTTAADEATPAHIYVAKVPFRVTGQTSIAGLIRRDGELSATPPELVEVKRFAEIPRAGDRARSIHTPTVDDVRALSEIDTRQPPSSQHDHDLADVLGKRPVVLTFATPALCQSRVCGPTVDITEQLKQTSFRDSKVAFIHMEIFRGNNANNGLRPQVQAYNLQTEPWVFVIDRRGVIRAALEGGVGIDELERQVRRVARS